MLRFKNLTKRCRAFNTINVSKMTKLKNDQHSHDMIGLPDPVSNLRPVIFAHSTKETCLEKKHRELRKETQAWNEAFWSKHNTNFIEERKQFQEMLRAQGKIELTADDMSVFYKQFLDKNWQTHLNYNIAWYRRNIKILFLGVAAKISKIKLK